VWFRWRKGLCDECGRPVGHFGKALAGVSEHVDTGERSVSFLHWQCWEAMVKRAKNVDFKVEFEDPEGVFGE
jgi:hypothetical protein